MPAAGRHIPTDLAGTATSAAQGQQPEKFARLRPPPRRRTRGPGVSPLSLTPGPASLAPPSTTPALEQSPRVIWYEDSDLIPNPSDDAMNHVQKRAMLYGKTAMRPANDGVFNPNWYYNPSKTRTMSATNFTSAWPVCPEPPGTSHFCPERGAKRIRLLHRHRM